MLDLSTGPGIFEMTSWEPQNRVCGFLTPVPFGTMGGSGSSLLTVHPACVVSLSCLWPLEIESVLGLSSKVSCIVHVEEGQLWCLTGLVMPLEALRVHQAGNTEQLHK